AVAIHVGKDEKKLLRDVGKRLFAARAHEHRGKNTTEHLSGGGVGRTGSGAGRSPRLTERASEDRIGRRSGVGGIGIGQLESRLAVGPVLVENRESALR